MSVVSLWRLEKLQSTYTNTKGDKVWAAIRITTTKTAITKRKKAAVYSTQYNKSEQVKLDLQSTF